MNDFARSLAPLAIQLTPPKSIAFKDYGRRITVELGENIPGAEKANKLLDQMDRGEIHFFLDHFLEETFFSGVRKGSLKKMTLEEEKGLIFLWDGATPFLKIVILDAVDIQGVIQSFDNVAISRGMTMHLPQNGHKEVYFT